MLWKSHKSPPSIKMAMDSAVVLNASSFVKEEVEHFKRNSPFLLHEEQEHKPIPHFCRSEIVVGELLGAGSFCEVYNVKKIVLEDDKDLPVSQEDTSGRSSFRKEVADKRKKRRRPNNGFVIKHVSATLVEQQVGFCKAARDLALEACYLSNLDHPHILKVRGTSFGGSLDSGKYDGLFMLAERLTQTLQERLKRWKLYNTSPFFHSQHYMIWDKLRYGYQLASALAYLHKNRIVFRDLKPANIGFQGDNIKLFDFGLCIELPPESDTAARITMGNDIVYNLHHAGTRRYSSPEMLACAPYNEKTDVYSWSIVFHEMLTHNRPFAEYNSASISLEVISNNRRPNLSSCGIPSKIKSLMLMAWDADICDRMSMEDVCAFLDAYSEEQHHNDSLHKIQPE